MRTGALAAVVAIAAVCGGCSITATVVDLADHKTTVEKVALEGARQVTVWESGKLISIPLKQVAKIELFMDETVTYQRELYYLARVELRDGKGTFSSGRVVEKPEEMTYVRVADVITGVIDKARFRMTLDQVKSATFD